MGQIKYNKLVRDRIPEIIEASGKNCVAEILSDEDYLCMIDAKLDEELAEYHKDQNIEELADLIEVIYAATKARGYTLEQLETVRAEKAAKRGIFQKKLLLKKVIDPNPNSKILEKIRQNQSAIMEKLNPKVLASYCWLQDNLHKRNVAVDTEYRKKFSGYYRMRFVSQEYRDQFFELFEEIKSESSPSFRVVSQKLFQVDGKHDADHTKDAQTLTITFNHDVTYKSSNGTLASAETGTTLVINYTYHQNPTDNIGLGDVVVTSEPGLAITGVSITD